MTKHTPVTHGVAKHNIFANRWGAFIAHEEPEGGSSAGAGAGDDDAAKAAAADKVAADAAAKAAAEKNDDKKPSDAEAKLLKESMDRKQKLDAAEKEKAALAARLAAFGDVDPEAVKAMLQERADAEKAKAEAAGDFERVKKMMAEEAEKRIKTIEAERDAAREERSKLLGDINELTIGQAFLASKFIQDELVLTPTKTRTVYGAHFERSEDGRIVGFDKPKGAAERTKLVDATGEPLNFEAALARLVETDPERDQVKKAKMATGTGGKPPVKGEVKKTDTSEKTGAARITAVLASRAAKK